MDKIASFQIDHRILPCGMYISRVDDDIITYDIRTRKPNKEEVMDNGALHTVEHLFATFARNSEYKDHIIYFGPMGCRTGYYFITRNLEHSKAIKLVKDTFDFIANYEGEIPGATEIECGNYRDHNLPKAREDAKEMANILKNWDESLLKYPE